MSATVGATGAATVATATATAAVTTRPPAVLFVLKYRSLDNGSPGEYEAASHAAPQTHPHHPRGQGLSSGLFNSARFVSEMLQAQGVRTKLVQVLDNNFIDREVTLFRPTHVIIEALWVVPEKFPILRRLHPTVTWIIRNHSETPFLANEGNGIDWLLKYVAEDKVCISGNSPVVNEEMRFLITQAHPDWPIEKVRAKCPLLPNYYEMTEVVPRSLADREDEYVDIACFGAIRPLKNQLLQAIASMQFCNAIGKKLRFHVNAGRVETKGDPVIKNIRALFTHAPQHALVEHDWCQHGQFINLVRQMDIGLQVSFSETFNIVTADMVNQGVPVVVSDEVSWVDPIYYAITTDANDICKKMLLVWAQVQNGTYDLQRNRTNLRQYLRQSERAWLGFLRTL